MATSSATSVPRSPSRAGAVTKHDPATTPSTTATRSNDPGSSSSRFAAISRAQALTGMPFSRSASMIPRYAVRQPAALISAIAPASAVVASLISITMNPARGALLRRLQVGPEVLRLPQVRVGGPVVLARVVVHDSADDGMHRPWDVDLLGAEQRDRIEPDVAGGHRRE